MKLIIYNEKPDIEPLVLEGGLRFELPKNHKREGDHVLIHEDVFREHFLNMTGGNDILELKRRYHCGSCADDEPTPDGEMTPLQAFTRLNLRGSIFRQMLKFLRVI
jgi:hypothetical protein